MRPADGDDKDVVFDEVVDDGFASRVAVEVFAGATDDEDDFNKVMAVFRRAFALCEGGGQGEGLTLEVT